MYIYRFIDLLKSNYGSLVEKIINCVFLLLRILIKIALQLTPSYNKRNAKNINTEYQYYLWSVRVYLKFLRLENIMRYK